MTSPPVNQQIQQTFNTPSKPESPTGVGGRNQKDRRYNDTFWDEHRHPRRFPKGRPWSGPREIAANRDNVPPPEDGFVIGDLMRGEFVTLEDGVTCDRPATLMSAWNAPWTPMAKYFKFNYRRKSISFMYAQMRMDEELGLRAYWKAAAKMANRIGLTLHEGRLPPSQILEELGEPSQMILVAEAAMARDPWLLGWIDEPNPKLAEILNIPTERGIVSLAQPVPDYLAAQAVKVEAINTAPPDVDVLQMLAQMATTMKSMQDQMNAMQTKKTAAQARMANARSHKQTKKPAEAQPA